MTTVEPDLEFATAALLRALCRRDGALSESPSPSPQRGALLERLQADAAGWADWLGRQELAGYCFALLADTGLDQALLPAAREPLERAYRRQVKRNQRLLELLQAMDAKLAAAAVPYLLIKGFAVSLRFAGGLHRRLMWDQDILVRPGDLAAVMAAAESLGLEARAGTGLDPKRLIRTLHAIELKDNRRKLDVHWVFRNRRGMQLGYADAAATAQRLRLGDLEVRALADLDLLTMSALSLVNDMERSGIKLRKVWDIYLMVARLDGTTDWSAWLQRADVAPLRRTLLNVIAFCLALAAADNDCPRLRAELAGHADLLLGDRAQALRMLRRPRQSLANRWLMARVQPVSAGRWWAWWLGTLPVRVWHGRKL